MSRDDRAYNAAIDDLYQISKKYEFIDPSANTKANWELMRETADKSLLNRASLLNAVISFLRRNRRQLNSSELLQELIIERF